MEDLYKNSFIDILDLTSNNGSIESDCDLKNKISLKTELVSQKIRFNIYDEIESQNSICLSDKEIDDLQHNINNNKINNIQSLNNDFENQNFHLNENGISLFKLEEKIQIQQLYEITDDQSGVPQIIENLKPSVEYDKINIEFFNEKTLEKSIDLRMNASNSKESFKGYQDYGQQNSCSNDCQDFEITDLNKFNQYVRQSKIENQLNPDFKSENQMFEQKLKEKIEKVIRESEVIVNKKDFYLDNELNRTQDQRASQFSEQSSISDIEKYDTIDISLGQLPFLKNEIKFNKNAVFHQEKDQNQQNSDDESQLDKIIHSKFSSKVNDGQQDLFHHNDQANNLKDQIFQETLFKIHYLNPQSQQSYSSNVFTETPFNNNNLNTQSQQSYSSNDVSFQQFEKNSYRSNKLLNFRFQKGYHDKYNYISDDFNQEKLKKSKICCSFKSTQQYIFLLIFALIIFTASGIYFSKQNQVSLVTDERGNQVIQKLNQKLEELKKVISNQQNNQKIDQQKYFDQIKQNITVQHNKEEKQKDVELQKLKNKIQQMNHTLIEDEKIVENLRNKDKIYEKQILDLNTTIYNEKKQIEELENKLKQKSQNATNFTQNFQSQVEKVNASLQKQLADNQKQKGEIQELKQQVQNLNQSIWDQKARMKLFICANNENEVCSCNNGKVYYGEKFHGEFYQSGNKILYRYFENKRNSFEQMKNRYYLETEPKSGNVECSYSGVTNGKHNSLRMKTPKQCFCQIQ